MVAMDGQGEEVLGGYIGRAGGGSWWLVARMTSPPKDSSMEEPVPTLQLLPSRHLLHFPFKRHFPLARASF
jgi:hypothetical protein